MEEPGARARATRAVVWSIGIIGTALSAIPGVWLEQYTNFMMVLGAVLVPVGGVLVAHYYGMPRVSGQILIFPFEAWTTAKIDLTWTITPGRSGA